MAILKLAKHVLNWSRDFSPEQPSRLLQYLELYDIAPDNGREQRPNIHMSRVPKETSKQFSLERMFRSDAFRHMCDILSRMPELQRIVREKLVTVFAVVDANRVNSELRWRLRRRKNQDARTSLHEALDSGVVVLVAPTHLRTEIEDDLAEIAQQCGATLEQARHEWNDFASKLLFYSPRSVRPSEPSIDPDDLPYKLTSEQLGLPVYTSDRHLVRMGAPVLWACVDIDTALRAHARSGSITVGCTLGSAMSVTVGIGAIKSAVRLITNAYSGFSRLPTWLQLIIAGAISVLMLHPKSRAKIAAGWRHMSAALGEIREPVLDVLCAIAEEAFEASQKLGDTKHRILEKMPQLPSRVTALVRARRICLLANTPLYTREISQRMHADGYISRAKDFNGYLRRTLRSSSQFLEVGRDRWQLCSTEGK